MKKRLRRRFCNPPAEGLTTFSERRTSRVLLLNRPRSNSKKYRKLLPWSSRPWLTLRSKTRKLETNRPFSTCHPRLPTPTCLRRNPDIIRSRARTIARNPRIRAFEFEIRPVDRRPLYGDFTGLTRCFKHLSDQLFLHF